MLGTNICLTRYPVRRKVEGQYQRRSKKGARMRKIVVLVFVAMMLVGLMAGPAFAADDWAEGLKGADQVRLLKVGGNFDNPGKLFQALRLETGMNPKEWTAYLFDDRGSSVDTVGERIRVFADQYDSWLAAQ